MITRVDTLRFSYCGKSPYMLARQLEKLFKDGWVLQQTLAHDTMFFTRKIPITLEEFDKDFWQCMSNHDDLADVINELVHERGYPLHGHLTGVRSNVNRIYKFREALKENTDA